MAAKLLKGSLQPIVDNYNADVREGEEALERERDGVCIPGDGVRMEKVGLNDPGKKKRTLERVTAVGIKRKECGTKKQFEAASEDLLDYLPRAEQETKELDIDIARLQSELRVKFDRKKLIASTLNEKQQLFDGMNNARTEIRDLKYQPDHIVAEVHARKRSINSATIGRQQQLVELVAKLRADGDRQKNQTDSNGLIINVAQLEEYVGRAAADQNHRAHDFWRDRVYSASEWDNFAAWCNRMAYLYQGELDELKKAAADQFADELQELTSFYLEGLE